MDRDPVVRPLDEAAVEALVGAFCVPGWNKEPQQYTRYLDEHRAGTRHCLVAWCGDEVAGYVTIVWQPEPAPPRVPHPEVVDLNVIERFRRRGVASALMDEAETIVAERSSIVALAVGLHPGYDAAQRLYVLRGYVPDGHGVTYEGRPVTEGQTVAMDDALVLHFEKHLG